MKAYTGLSDFFAMSAAHQTVGHGVVAAAGGEQAAAFDVLAGDGRIGLGQVRLLALLAAQEGRLRTAALLLRLSFLEPASGRAVLFEHHRPDVLILPRRPAFDGRGTDNITSAWFVWPGTGRLVWLPP